MSTSATSWNPPAVRAFELVFRPWMHWRMAGIQLAGLPTSVPDQCSVIMAANHVSWWDAFILREAQRKCAPGKPLLTLMRESELQRFPFFRWMGVVGVESSTAGLRRALKEVTAVTNEPPWVTLFPQGKLRPSWQRPLHFKKGVAAFARVLAPAVIIPFGLHYEMQRSPNPTAFANAHTPLYVNDDDRADIQMLERRVDQALSRIYQMLRSYGSDAPFHWPNSPFDALPVAPDHEPSSPI